MNMIAVGALAMIGANPPRAGHAALAQTSHPLNQTSHPKVSDSVVERPEAGSNKITAARVPLAPGLGTNDMTALNQRFNVQFLMLQQQMQMENRQFTTLSNVMKTKHETASAAISNIK
jgi:hypothetical protein